MSPLENPNFRDLKTFVKAAHRAGYSKEERRVIAEDPIEGLAVEVNEPLTKGFVPEKMNKLLRILEEKPGPTQGIAEIGIILAEFEKRQAPVSESELRLINLIIFYIEEGFYQGNFLGLKANETAGLAFIINRLAKLKQASSDIMSFDPDRLNQFVQNVSNYEEGYMLKQHGFTVKEHKQLQGLQQKYNIGYMTTAEQERWQELKKRRDEIMQAANLHNPAHRTFMLSRQNTTSQIEAAGAADLYLLKAMLVAQDQHRKQTIAQGGQGTFVPLESIPQELIQEHNFLTERNVQKLSRFHLVHYSALQMPFAYFAVQYLSNEKSLRRQKETEKKRANIKIL